MGPTTSEKAVRARFSPTHFISQSPSSPPPRPAERTRASRAPQVSLPFFRLGELGPGLGSCRRTASERTPSPIVFLRRRRRLARRGARGPLEAGLRGSADPDRDTGSKEKKRSLSGASRRLSLYFETPGLRPSKVAEPSLTLVGRKNLPSNLGAHAASPARTDAATDHLNFGPE